MRTLHLHKDFAQDKARNFWPRAVCQHLFKSNQFKIELHDINPSDTGAFKSHMSSLIKLDDKWALIDTWDNPNPTLELYQKGHFQNTFPFNKLSIIFKIQYKPKPIFNEIAGATGIPIMPLSMFAHRDFPLEAFEWQMENHKHVISHFRLGPRLGKRLKWLSPYYDKKKFNIYSHKNDFEFEDYIETLADTRWGLILGGKGQLDRKNRREVEFTSLGMPLAMNYIPYYKFKMIPNRDFVYLEKPEDIYNLKYIDPYPFAQRSKYLYENYFSPKGMASLLVDYIDRYGRS